MQLVQVLLKQHLKKKQRQIYLVNKQYFAVNYYQLIQSGFETVVEAGYQPRISLF